jgi:glutathione synthase/RimK-type ligase-like ATP-grasp enzyme
VADGLLDNPGIEFPAIIRPSCSHAGKNLARIEDRESLRTYLKTISDDLFYVAPFIDYRSADGFWRKYRLVFVAGRPFPYHLAIHSDWAIWYYNARMDLDPWKRSEEARFVRDIREAFPEQAVAALQVIGERVGLDYFGVDCGVMPDGRLVVFEIETGMIVHDWDAPNSFPYRQDCVRSIRRAFEAMIDFRVAASAHQN